MQNNLPGSTYQNRRKGLKRQGAFVKPKAVQPETKKDAVQDQQIKRLKRELKKISPPVKSTYIEDTENPENAWIGFTCNYPAKGGAVNERLGDEIIVKSLNIRYTLSVSETDNFDTMRVVFVQWIPSNAFGELVVNNDSLLWESTPTDFPVNSPYNTQSAPSYKVLYDKVHNLNENGVAQISENILITSRDLRVTKLKFQTDAGGQLPALNSGLIIGYVCSDSTAAPNPKIESSIKLNFTDT